VWSARVLPVVVLVAGGVGHMKEGCVLYHSLGDARGEFFTDLLNELTCIEGWACWGGL